MKYWGIWMESLDSSKEGGWLHDSNNQIYVYPLRSIAVEQLKLISGIDRELLDVRQFAEDE